MNINLIQKEETKEETKEEIKEETKEEIKDEVKSEVKPIKKKQIYKSFLKFQKLLCHQVITLLLLLFLYKNLINNNIYDFVIYFCFGIFISILSNSFLMLIKKNNILKSIDFNTKYYLNSFNFLKKFLDISEKKICLLMFLVSVSWHVIFPLIALYYVKSYIKKSIKTKNCLKLSILLYMIYLLFNIFKLNTFKIYNNSLNLTTTEFKILLTSITVTYMGLIYYFETIKNETPKNIIG
jgi:hypothetical protein